MIATIILDSGPLGLLAQRPGLPIADADPKELDADVIVAAQAVTGPWLTADLIVATTNPVHLARFVKADLWTRI